MRTAFASLLRTLCRNPQNADMGSGHIEKKYYKISQVAEMLDIPISTLRYWERQFTIIKPTRTDKGTRMYTSEDIEKIRMVHFLVKERGIRIEVAQEMIRHNHAGISKQYKAVARLKEMRQHLMELLAAMQSIRR